MRQPPHEAERFRITDGPMASPRNFGNCGAFQVVVNGVQLNVIVSDGKGWEHVSVSHKTRCPNWQERRVLRAEPPIEVEVRERDQNVHLGVPMSTPFWFKCKEFPAIDFGTFVLDSGKRTAQRIINDEVTKAFELADRYRERFKEV